MSFVPRRERDADREEERVGHRGGEKFVDRLRGFAGVWGGAMKASFTTTARNNITTGAGQPHRFRRQRVGGDAEQVERDRQTAAGGEQTHVGVAGHLGFVRVHVVVLAGLDAALTGQMREAFAEKIQGAGPAGWR